MTVETLIQKLNELAEDVKDGACKESSHVDADDLLLEFINDERVTEAFNSIEKWYS